MTNPRMVRDLRDGLTYILHKKKKEKQDVLCLHFATDQSTVSRRSGRIEQELKGPNEDLKTLLSAFSALDADTLIAIAKKL